MSCMFEHINGRIIYIYIYIHTYLCVFEFLQKHLMVDEVDGESSRALTQTRCGCWFYGILYQLF